MKIIIESTKEMTFIDGVQVRVWKGTTEKGTPCVVFVRRIAVLDGKEEEFARELVEKQTPEELKNPVQVVLLRQIL
jgi:hypothetical protein